MDILKRGIRLGIERVVMAATFTTTFAVVDLLLPNPTILVVT